MQALKDAYVCLNSWGLFPTCVCSQEGLTPVAEAVECGSLAALCAPAIRCHVQVCHM